MDENPRQHEQVCCRNKFPLCVMKTWIIVSLGFGNYLKVKEETICWNTVICDYDPLMLLLVKKKILEAHIWGWQILPTAAVHLETTAFN